MSTARFETATWSIIVLLALAPGIAQLQETEPARGAALLAPLKEELKQALVAGMQNGPVNAIGVCMEQAPAITAALSSEGVVMGRTSHRLRNPQNRAPDWVDAVLRAYLVEESEYAPRTLRLPNHREGYVEPIMVAPLCLACHGESLTPEVEEQVRRLYPEDEATGFSLGDLRGVYWIEYPVTE